MFFENRLETNLLECGIETSEVAILPDILEKYSEAEILPDSIGNLSDITSHSEELDMESFDDKRELSEAESLPDSLDEFYGGDMYFDDTNSLYRIENNLIENKTYQLNGYTFHTDEFGRIESVSGLLHLKDHEGRLEIEDSIQDIGKGDQIESDDRGHLIADRFDGPNRLENLIPQDAHINRISYKNFESQLAKEVEDGKTVFIEIDVCYDDFSYRPDALVVSYCINDDWAARIFPNSEESSV